MFYTLCIDIFRNKNTTSYRSIALVIIMYKLLKSAFIHTTPSQAIATAKYSARIDDKVTVFGIFYSLKIGQTKTLTNNQM